MKVSFKDIKGQQRLINFLVRSVENNQLAHAYLFIGPEGVGKNSVARNLAKLVNCENQVYKPCDECIACIKIDKLSHPDVHWLEKGSGGSIRIEDIRQLQSQINLRPYEGKKKVFIIKQAENLTAEAANALLKTLEEPPGDSLIILTAWRTNKIFPTILSRCQKIVFSLLDRSQLRDLLIKEYRLDKDCAHFLAFFSEGRPGRAMELKEKNIIEEKNRIIDLLRKPLDTSIQENIIGFKDKAKLKEILEIWLTWFRDLWLIKAGFSDLNEQIINTDCQQSLLKNRERYSFQELDNAVNLIVEAEGYLEQNVNLRLLFNFLKIKLWKE